MTPIFQSRKVFKFWPGWLLLLPIIVLGVVGAIFVQKDKDSVKSEAKEFARLLAENIADSGWNAMGAGGRWAWHPSAGFKVDNAGRLLSPPPIESLLPPPLLNPAGLTQEQRSVWEEFNRQEQAGQLDMALATAQSFLQLTPPESFVTAAGWRRGLLLVKAGRVDEAETVVQDLRRRFPEARAESGLPLTPLVDLKLFEIALLNTNRSTELTAAVVTLCSNAVNRPTLLSADLLRRAEELGRPAGVINFVSPWLAKWRDQEEIRKLYLATAPELARSLVTAPSPDTKEFSQNEAGNISTRLPRMFWVDLLKATDPKSIFKSPNAFRGLPGKYLVVCMPDMTNANWVQLTHEDAVRMYFHSDIQISAKGGVAAQQRRAANTSGVPIEPWTGRQMGGMSNLREGFGVSMDLAGRTIFSPKQVPTETLGPSGKTGGPTRAFIDPDIAPSEILATARRPADGPPQLVVRIHLTKPDQLYGLQRKRRDYFAMIIGGSLVIAIVGLVATRRAFNRQLALNEMKSNFVSSVSHELRAPIASVRLMAEGLERGNVVASDKQHEYFRFIVQECRRLTSLIENVLDFSRIEQGRKQYEFEPTDPVALVEETIKLMQPAAAERGVNLILLPSDTQLSTLNSQLRADSRALQQALINLIDNALKHSPDGQTVTAGLEVGATDDSYSIRHPAYGIRFFVQDHGDGIPPEEHEKIFERFYRCGSELRRETQGVGIGLSIVKHIVEAHGGRVTVRSAVGQGSRFTIDLSPRMDTNQND